MIHMLQNVIVMTIVFALIQMSRWVSSRDETCDHRSSRGDISKTLHQPVGNAKIYRPAHNGKGSNNYRSGVIARRRGQTVIEVTGAIFFILITITAIYCYTHKN